MIRLRWALLPVAFVILITNALVLVPSPSPASADCGANASSCKICHEGEQKRAVNTGGIWHAQHAFGDFCANCHAGDRTASDQTAAHAGMQAVLAGPQAACARCHAADYQAKAALYSDEQQRGAATAVERTNPPPGSLFTLINAVLLVGLTLAVWAWEKGPFAQKARGATSPPGTPLEPPLRGNPLARPRWSPYWAGAGLGVVGVLTLWISQQPLGSSGAFMTAASALLKAVGAPLADSVYFRFVSPPAITWQLLLVIGVVAGALLSALWSGDFRLETAPDLWIRVFGPARWKRWAAMFAGGAILEYGASVAGGCTSGLAIAGSFQLSAAGFLFIGALFTTGLITARLLYGRNY